MRSNFLEVRMPCLNNHSCMRANIRSAYRQKFISELVNEALIGAVMLGFAGLIMSKLRKLFRGQLHQCTDKLGTDVASHELSATSLIYQPLLFPNQMLTPDRAGNQRFPDLSPAACLTLVNAITQTVIVKLPLVISMVEICVTPTNCTTTSLADTPAVPSEINI
jgi:hypothetical protein